MELDHQTTKFISQGSTPQLFTRSLSSSREPQNITLPESNIAPENSSSKEEAGSSSNHPFSGAKMLVSGSVVQEVDAKVLTMGTLRQGTLRQTLPPLTLPCPAWKIQQIYLSISVARKCFQTF